MIKKKKRLPKEFKPLMCGYKFNLMDVERDKRIIIVNTVNYGNLNQWRWLIKTYGRDRLRKIINLIPETEFRKDILKLMKLLFNIKKLKYASRGAQIRAEKNI